MSNSNPDPQTAFALFRMANGYVAAQAPFLFPTALPTIYEVTSKVFGFRVYPEVNRVAWQRKAHALAHGLHYRSARPPT